MGLFEDRRAADALDPERSLGIAEARAELTANAYVVLENVVVTGSDASISYSQAATSAGFVDTTAPSPVSFTSGQMPTWPMIVEFERA